MLVQGERPRQNEQTRAAERALDDAEATEDEAQARAFYQQALESAEAAIAADPTNPLAHRLAAMAAPSPSGARRGQNLQQEIAEAEAARIQDQNKDQQQQQQQDTATMSSTSVAGVQGEPQVN